MQSNIELPKQIFSVKEVTEKVMAKFADLPDNEKKKIETGDTYGLCGTFSLSLRKIIGAELPVKTACSEHEDNNSHTFLLIPGNSSEEDIIIDPTVNQFLKDYKGIFIGTRKGLRELVLNPKTKIINTKSKNNPQEAFERTWGSTSSISY